MYLYSNGLSVCLYSNGASVCYVLMVRHCVNIRNEH